MRCLCKGSESERVMGLKNIPFVEERRGKILEILEIQHRVEVPELARHFQVSEDTIRRDLRFLQRCGLIKKTHGGAVRRHLSSLPPYDSRLEQERDIKEAIGKRAADLVEENDSLIIESSTTTLWFAHALQVHHARILTNDLEIARLAAQKNYELIVLGGKWDCANHEMVGTSVLEQLSRYRVDKLFLGISALDAQNGLTGISDEEADVKRAMIEVSDRVIALADHSKIGEVGFAWIAEASVIDVLVTDEKADCHGFTELDWEIIRAS